MSILTIGNELLELQRKLGLRNPEHYSPGLRDAETVDVAFLKDLSRETDLCQLFLWRNGVSHDPSIPMADLWISPGWFMLSSVDVIVELEYLAATPEEWPLDWIPLFSDGAAGRLHYDLSKAAHDKGPVFYSAPDLSTVAGQIYDSIETMFRTMKSCYEESAYFLNREGLLEEDLRAVRMIAMGLNPASDFWEREDLC